ncbi:MAG: hypothetical protein ABIK09_19640 [Pseudomonadota bacterium]
MVDPDIEVHAASLGTSGMKIFGKGALRRLKGARWVQHLSLVLLGTMLGLVGAEVILRLSGIDDRILRSRMRWLDAMTEIHMAVEDPAFMFRLRPGSTFEGAQDYGPFSVRINALGFRGRERSLHKDEGVFRVVCVGASNVFGAGVNDGETWPAQLEERLNHKDPGRFEVWNLGVSAYNAHQMSAMGREALEKYEPDLLVFALSNSFPRHVPVGAEPDDYLRRDPLLWFEYFTWLEDGFPSFVSPSATIWLLEHFRLYRMVVFAQAAGQGDPHPQRNGERKHAELDMVRGFLEQAGQEVPIAVFLYPGVNRDRYRLILEGLPLEVFELRSRALMMRPFPNEALLDIHPPPEVYRWYAVQLKQWLESKGLVPKQGASCRACRKKTPVQLPGFLGMPDKTLPLLGPS